MSRREVRLHCRLKSLPIPKDDLVGFALDLMGRLNLQGEVGIKICSDRLMSDLNRRYRGKSGPTDVLSFPDGSPLSDGAIYLGDMVIAAGVATRAAKAAGCSVETELKRLLLHGLLHLSGYDHEADGGTMNRKERALRRELGLT
jgi:probable rRNA maturation factor